MRAFVTLLLFATAGVVACDGGNSASSTTGGGGHGTSSAGGGGSGAASSAGGGGAGGGTGGIGATGGGGIGGDPSAGGSANNGGSTNNGGSANNGGGTNTGGGAGAGGAMVTCAWGDDCGPLKYCFAPGCGAGTCEQKPVPSSVPASPDPVCGCDGATYWNAETAASKGQSVAMTGACPMPMACGPGVGCPAGMVCNRAVADSEACSPDAPGTCWGTPISCPVDGPKARACTTSTCELTCSLVQSQNPWFEDPTCN